MQAKILWADDEIDLLKPHVMFLEGKGYEVTTVTNGADAIDEVKQTHFDIIFLDENMPGLTGLETLSKIKTKYPSIPVVMITKSEEEYIMEDAIGQKISDYLIKPVNPNQILLSVKKNLDHSRLVSEKLNTSYQTEFREISMRLGDRLDTQEWKDLYKELVYWDIELSKNSDQGMSEILDSQKSEANAQFCKFVEKNYIDWLQKNSDDIPNMSHTIFKEKIAPEIKSNDPVFVLVIDNLRYDQWRTIRPKLTPLFNIEEEDLFYSILPTVTHYARNALFAGLMPSEIEKIFPDKWVDEESDEGRNLHEETFLLAQLKRLGKNVKTSYNKITNLNAGKRLADNFSNLYQNDLNVIVYNFVDMLSHARTDMEVIKELADDEAAYRSLTDSWFDHSPLYSMIKQIAEKGHRLIITTDHGSVHVKEPSKVVGDKNTSSNLRYKHGKSLKYSNRDTLEIKKPSDAFLPKLHVSSTFIFAKEDKFFVYPNNYNHYLKYYQNTFQHGGISLEEMLIPFVILSPKK